MKDKIHPKYNKNAKVTCACGNSFEIGSTEETITVDVCSACHPFYTGAHRFVDTAGRVDKYKEKLEKAKKFQEKNSKKEIKKNK
jgi:large subunit ribosomal protein L31